MKIQRKQLARIVREEYNKIYGRPKKEKTIRLTESKLRKMIRGEIKELWEDCGMGMSVDKHGSLSNPPQRPLEKAEDQPMGGMMSLGMSSIPEMDYMEEDYMEEDGLYEDDDMLYNGMY